MLLSLHRQVKATLKGTSVNATLVQAIHEGLAAGPAGSFETVPGRCVQPFFVVDFSLAEPSMREEEASLEAS